MNGQTGVTLKEGQVQIRQGKTGRTLRCCCIFPDANGYFSAAATVEFAGFAPLTSLHVYLAPSSTREWMRIMQEHLSA